MALLGVAAATSEARFFGLFDSPQVDIDESSDAVFAEASTELISEEQLPTTENVYATQEL